MGNLRNLITKGIRESAPPSQNIAKAFNVKQGKDEGCAEFLYRLKDQIRKHSGLDVEISWDREC
jgi:hypothetical protein